MGLVLVQDNPDTRRSFRRAQLSSIDCNDDALGFRGEIRLTVRLLLPKQDTRKIESYPEDLHVRVKRIFNTAPDDIRRLRGFPNRQMTILATTTCAKPGEERYMDCAVEVEFLTERLSMHDRKMFCAHAKGVEDILRNFCNHWRTFDWGTQRIGKLTVTSDRTPKWLRPECDKHGITLA